jgi:hypothetical protein
MKSIGLRAWLVVGALGCAGDKADETEPTETAPAADCADPDYNPWAGSCVDTFVVDCWDPEGSCDGTVELTGATTLAWENGALVEVTVDYTNPFDPTVLTDLIASDGSVCSSGVSTNNIDGCASRTIYTRTSDGAVMTFCAQLDGSVAVTCPDGTVVSATAAESEAANSCQYGDAETCTITGPI